MQIKKKKKTLKAGYKFVMILLNQKHLNFMKLYKEKKICITSSNMKG